MLLRIAYTKPDCPEEDRLVWVLSYDESTLHAMCRLRNSRRSFSIRRIREAIDMSTGEIIPSACLLTYLKENHD